VIDGKVDGALDGSNDGMTVGISDGIVDGNEVGVAVGDRVGPGDGAQVNSCPIFTIPFVAVLGSCQRKSLLEQPAPVS